MKFFIDTCNLDQIKKAMDMGVLDGVTTNPSLAAKESMPYRKILQEICQIVPGPVSAEVISVTHDEMVAEGLELVKIGKNIVVKIPTIPEGLKAVKTLSDKKIRVNSTLVFSPSQAILVAKAGAAYVSPFIGRLDDISQDGMSLIQQIVTIYHNYEFDTEVLVASVRHPMHVVESALLGADICTVPFSVIDALIKHPLTDIGLKKFLDDFKSSKANQ